MGEFVHLCRELHMCHQEWLCGRVCVMYSEAVVPERIDLGVGAVGRGETGRSLPASSSSMPWEVGGGRAHYHFPWCKTRRGGGHEPPLAGNFSMAGGCRSVADKQVSEVQKGPLRCGSG